MNHGAAKEGGTALLKANVSLASTSGWDKEIITITDRILTLLK
jgi:hypothetical protein